MCVCWRRPLSPRGRGREAMTYGRALVTCPQAIARWRGRKSFGRTGEGRLLCVQEKAPSSALRAPSPQGEKGPTARGRNLVEGLHGADGRRAGSVRGEGGRG